jgi:hypothetical protein
VCFIDNPNKIEWRKQEDDMGWFAWCIIAGIIGGGICWKISDELRKEEDERKQREREEVD